MDATLEFYNKIEIFIWMQPNQGTHTKLFNDQLLANGHHPKLIYAFMHTDIQTYWSLQPFSQDYKQASYTTYVMCVNFI